MRFWVKLAIKLFYRRIEIHGSDTYPRSGPVFLAPNHQNAFMDALIPSVFAPTPIHFLVRADVFRKPWLAAFLRSLNMMPVYRQRDGMANLAKNDEIFAKCFEILRRGDTLLIFPEMTHVGERKLRPLSKGFTRVLFGALKDQENLDIQVVPLGLNYSHYHKSGARLIVNWGQPIALSDYRNAYAESPARGMARLRADVEAALTEEVVHLPRKEANEAFEIELERIIPFYFHRASGFSAGVGEMDFYKRRERSLNELPEGHPYFRRIGIYHVKMRDLGLQAPFFFIGSKDAGYWVLQNLLLLAMLPIFALSWLLMAPSYLLIRGLLRRFIADRQFWSSIKLVGYLVLFPLFGLLYAGLAAWWSGRPLMGAVAALVFYPLSVFVIRELRLPYRYVLSLWRGLWLRWRKPELYSYLVGIESEVLKAYRQLSKRA